MQPPRQSTHLGPRDLFVALVINIMWGLNIIASKMAVEAIGPFTAVALRQAVVFIVCFTALRIVPGRMRPLLLLGVLSGAAFLVIINLSLLVTKNVSTLAIASQLGAPFSLLLGIVFLKEKIHLPRMIGIGLAFAGVVVLVFDPSGQPEYLGLGLTAISALIWAIGSLIQRQLRGVPVLTIYAWIGVIGTIILVPVAWHFEPATIRALPDLPLRDFGWVIFSAIGSSVLGQGGMAWLLQRHPISTVIPLTLASPVIAVVAASWFFETPLTPVMILGGILAMAGVTIITVRSARPGGGPVEKRA